jgi:hypothetical protein
VASGCIEVWQDHTPGSNVASAHSLESILVAPTGANGVGESVYEVGNWICAEHGDEAAGIGCACSRANCLPFA